MTMRLLFFNYEFPPIGGGGANANAYLFKAFAREADLTVDCVTSAWGERDETVRFAENIRLHRLAVGKRRLHFWTQREVLTYLWRARGEVTRLLEGNHFDLCHAFFGFPSGMLPWLLRDRLPYLISLRGSDVPGFNPRFSLQYVVLRPLFRRIWSGASCVATNSVGLRNLARDTAPDLEISVIPNGIDTEEFTPGTPSEREPGHLLCVSRLVARKGVQHLLEAMPAILNQVPTARLTVVGDGNLQRQLQRRSQELGLAEKVHFLGYVGHDALPALYRRAAVFVLPSFYEGMSNTVLEAMAAGLPIVATGEGGREELLQENARQAPFGDPAALARELTTILQDRAEAERMGNRSRQIAEEFSWSAVAGRYLDVYRTVHCSGRGGRG